MELPLLCKWTSLNGPSGGAVWCIAVDPTNASIIYAGTYGSGIYKSTDGGNSWTAINKGLTSSLLLPIAYDDALWTNTIVIDPTNNSIIHAGTDGDGAYKSTDGGQNWIAINNDGLTDSKIFSLAVDPTNTSIIYAGTYGVIIKSTDGGNKWTFCKGGLPNLYIISLAIGPANTSTIYAGSQGGVFKSIDAGDNWTAVNSGLTDSKIFSLAIDPKNPSIIYAGTLGMKGMFKSTNGGNSWAPSNSGINIAAIFSLAIDPSNTNIIYAGSLMFLYKSTDGGSSWTIASTGLHALGCIMSLAIDPANTNITYAGVEGDGIFKSTDGGSNWTAVNNGLTNLDVFSLTIDPTNTSTIYAGTSGGVFKSTDGGSNWTAFNDGLTNLSVGPLAMDPTDTSIVYAGTLGGGVFKYTCISILSPSPPQNLTTSTSESSITLTWSASTQGTYPLAGYAIYRGTTSGGEDATPLAKVDASTTTYTDTNVTLGTDYYYYVKAYDNQDPANYSDPSNEVSAKIVDTTSPDVSISRPTDNATVESDSVSVAGKAADTQSGIDKVTVNGVEVSVSSDGSFSKTVNLSEGINRITVIAKDKAGNETKKIITVTYKKPVQTIVIILQIGNTSFTVNGVTNILDSPPVIKNNRTLLPIRAIIESLGGTVLWDATERKVTVILGSKTIELWIGKSIAKVNGIDTPIDATNPKVVPEIINSRTMLPLRFVAENVGATVEWDGTTKTITVTYQKT